MALSTEEAKVIAQVLIAKTGNIFDSCAFEEADELLTEDEIEQIITQIKKICNSTLVRLNKKYSLNLGSVNSTKEIIEEILYE